MKGVSLGVLFFGVDSILNGGWGVFFVWVFNVGVGVRLLLKGSGLGWVGSSIGFDVVVGCYGKREEFEG